MEWKVYNKYALATLGFIFVCTKIEPKVCKLIPYKLFHGTHLLIYML